MLRLLRRILIFFSFLGTEDGWIGSGGEPVDGWMDGFVVLLEVVLTELVTVVYLQTGLVFRIRITRDVCKLTHPLGGMIMTIRIIMTLKPLEY